MGRTVLLVTTELDPVRPGGAGTVVAELVTRLRDAGHRAVVVLVTDDVVDAADPDVVVVAPDPTDPAPFLARSRRAAKAVAEIVARLPVDLVEFHDFEALAFWAMTHRSELGLEHTRLAVRYHLPADHILDAISAGAGVMAPIRVAEREVFALADVVIAPSQAMAEVVGERYEVERTRLLVGEPQIPEVPRVERSRGAEPRFAVLGRLGEQKGSDVMIEAAAPVLRSHPDASVVFIGSDGWSVSQNRSMREWLRELIPPDLSDRFVFVDRVDRADLAAQLAGFWAIVIPSRLESFCLAAHEARAMGLPVVLADLPAFAGYFSPDTGAVLYDGTASGLGAALSGLIENPAEVDRLAAMPLPAYGDPLQPYAGPLPEPRPTPSQQGLATGAVHRLEAAMIESSHLPRGRRLARAGLRLLPDRAAALAVRIVPQSLKDRFRGLASWPEEQARRQEERRLRQLRERVAGGEFAELTQPLVTVVIACFNQGQFLREALMSVFEQTLDSFEVVIVDDGSTDLETGRVLETLDWPRVRLVRQQNRGLPAARNAGIEMARGQFVVPLDADDALTPEFLKIMVDAVGDDGKVAYAHCYAQYFGDQEGIWMTRPFNSYQLLASNSVVGCVLLRRSAWEAVGGYDETLVAGNEDWDLWLRLLEAGWSQTQVRWPLFRYRRHGVTMSVDTLGRFEEARRELVHHHPGLYGQRQLEELKRANYPWVSVLVTARSDLSALRAQDLDDVELVDRASGVDLETLCQDRSWGLQRAEPELAAAVGAASGKFVIDWDVIVTASATALSQLANDLEDSPAAAGAEVPGDDQTVLWRRWVLHDPASAHGDSIVVEAELTTQTVLASLHRGAFPRPGWYVEPALAALGEEVIRQPPEEEGRLPAWVPQP